MKSTKIFIKRLSFILISLALTSQLTASGTTPTATIKNVSGVPGLIINGRLYPPFAYMSYLGKTQYYKEIAEAGIHLYCFPAYLSDRGINPGSGIGPFRPSIWREKKQYDFSSIIRDFEQILSADPEAMVFIRFHLDPPAWWEQSHPEASCQLADGTTFRQCFSSNVWRKSTGDVLSACTEWLLNSPFTEHLIGIHVAAGWTEEWFYHFIGDYYDKNPARTTAFQRWLRNAYKNDITIFRNEWNDPGIDFNIAKPADISGTVRKQEWRNPETDQHIIDTFRFHSETMVDNIAFFCNIVKNSSNHRLLTGAFYGYHYFVTDPRRGHGALHKLLQCPDLDYLSSPNCYHRIAGEDWPPMTAIHSIQKHGKLWLAENDTRTSITTLLKQQAPHICPPGQYESGVWLGPPDMKTSVALLWKNTARMLAHGYGGWWFDMWGGWFSHPELMTVLHNTQDLWQKYPPKLVPEMQAEICVIVDEELCFYDASFGGLTEKILSNRYSLAKTGAPYDLYLRQDWASVSSDRYRILWFWSPSELTQFEMSTLKKYIDQNVTILLTNPHGTRLIKFLPGESGWFDKKYQWSPAELMKHWQKAGVHLYIETEDVLYAGRGWLTIHTINGGERCIKLPFPADIIDPLIGERLAESCMIFKTTLPEKSTIFFHVIPSK